MPEFGDQNAACFFAQLCVAIQEYEEIRPCSARAHVRGRAESDICPVHYHAETSIMEPDKGLGSSVRRRVVDDNHLSDSGRPQTAHDSGWRQGSGVIADDDNRNRVHQDYLGGADAVSAAVPASPPLISVLTVNFNSSSLLRRCLDALARSTIADRLQIIVVDNSSSDFDVAEFHNRYPVVTFLPQAANLAYTGGNNVAFREATGEFILMLNPDTEVEPEALENAISHFRGDPSLIGVGAYLIGRDGKLQRYYRRLPTLRDLPAVLFEPIFGKTRRGRRYLMLDESFEDPTVVEQPPGAFFMFRRVGSTSLALLDSGYFNFFSDVELCRRLLKSGRIEVFPDVRSFHHRAGAGVGTRNPRARLRLYHDFVWGLERYLGVQLTVPQRLYLAALTHAYLVTRVIALALRSPLYVPAALATLIKGIKRQPPSYR